MFSLNKKLLRKERKNSSGNIPQNLNRQLTFRKLLILIVKLRLTSVKQIYAIGRSVKTFQQSIDLIFLG